MEKWGDDREDHTFLKGKLAHFTVLLEVVGLTIRKHTLGH